MGAQKYWKDESRKNYYSTVEDGHGLSHEGLRTGALMRIADATEAIAANHQRVVDERDDYKRRYEQGREEIQRLNYRMAAYKAWITRLKRKAATK